MRQTWLAQIETKRLRWGGDLRRYHLFRELIRITGATQMRGWSAADVAAGLAEVRGGRPRLVSAELLPLDALEVARSGARLSAVDLHDHPAAQRAAFGFSPDPELDRSLRLVFEANLAAFRSVIAPSVEFARLVGLPASRVLVAANGTDTAAIRPGPWPDGSTVVMLSGASPGRGIEETIAACRLVRAEAPDLRLMLGVAPTGDESARYLARLADAIAAETWITAGPVDYPDVPGVLAGARVAVIPYPAGAYMDSALPVKLFDYMAAARPIVTTPRIATAAIVERCHAGVVTAGDAPDDLAAGIGRLLADSEGSRRMGLAGRAAAESEFDWRVIGARLADQLIRREDRRFWVRRRIALMRGRTI